MIEGVLVLRPHSLADKPSDSESEDWLLESLCGRFFLVLAFFIKRTSKNIVLGEGEPHVPQKYRGRGRAPSPSLVHKSKVLIFIVRPIVVEKPIF